jgi:hypothetical protein
MKVWTPDSRTFRVALRGAAAAVLMTAAWSIPSLSAQAPNAQAPQGQRGAGAPPQGQPGGRGRGPIIAATPFSDAAGFDAMFDGKSLAPGEDMQKQRAAAAAPAPPQPAGQGRGRGPGGPPISRFQDWDGDPRFWRVENGMIVGESAADKTVGPNSFLIWRGATPGDFELKVEIKMNSTNSGIQFRSKMLPANAGLPAGQAGHQWRLGGYQMDMDFDNVYPGQLYEEAGRGFLAERGTITYIGPDGTKGVITWLSPSAEFARPRLTTVSGSGTQIS